MLAPGLGMSTDSYLLTSTPRNLVERLVAEGFDVWLFDPRMSISLDSSDTKYSLDDLALVDWRAGIDKVREVTGARDVQIVAHCVGSATALITALENPEGIRAMVCSQMAAHFDVPKLTKFRARLRPAGPLQKMGLVSASPYTSRSIAAWVTDLVVRANPLRAGEKCDHSTCRWVFFFYGPTHIHGHLDAQSHSDMHRLFGRGSLAAMDQVGRWFVAGCLTDRTGNPKYMTNVAKLKMPILFLAGSENKLVRPRSSQLTLDWLAKTHGHELHRRKLLRGYAHLDTLIGRDADVDVFGHIVDFLNETATDGALGTADLIDLRSTDSTDSSVSVEIEAGPQPAVEVDQGLRDEVDIDLTGSDTVTGDPAEDATVNDDAFENTADDEAEPKKR